ncbi:uncharacterized protein LAESUDRAFT_720346 [Laetiporus sulphureus 93-53]|uniref:DUF6697 domain-containing protein n=1 Tax=Laetiporus sulphureus 93-53 TaxID=1314785 RepID=A0A165H2H7_9APHY|nr:uncharacterized protein LAESUDRAFT_720346 [Laetiporus sulphureus 93-53]KZT11155.1 hypothetical protein LAESUDRAFT_720346 [Laetiporus sulphureus 93-53]
MDIKLERMRVNEALNARDAVVRRFAEACVSVREKNTIIQNLKRERNDLERQLAMVNGRNAMLAAENPNTSTRALEERKNAKIALEVARLSDICKNFQHEIRMLRIHIETSGKEGDPMPESIENIHQHSRREWQTCLHRILLHAQDLAAAAATRRDAPSVSPRPASPLPLSPIVFTSPKSPEVLAPDLQMQALTLEDHEQRVATAMAAPDPIERIQARNAELAALPLPADIPPDVLRPITIPSPFTLHEFLGATPVLLRTQLGNYRVFQQTTTYWCPEREEHGYFLTPIYKCNTNPRVSTAHRWAVVDMAPKLNRHTECFYNKDGKWYYAGIYQAFWLDELTPAEWENLSNEVQPPSPHILLSLTLPAFSKTTQALVKETLAGRKNTSPQNVYETGQLYIAGALKVACIGLQCIGFNNNLYRMLLEHAAKCAQTGKWRATPVIAGPTWGAGAAANVNVNALQVSPVLAGSAVSYAIEGSEGSAGDFEPKA